MEFEMRTCSCGGSVDTSDLTGGRERWLCRQCGRYEIFDQAEEEKQQGDANEMLDFFDDQ
jgi:hypothetical protein